MDRCAPLYPVFNSLTFPTKFGITDRDSDPTIDPVKRQRRTMMAVNAEIYSIWWLLKEIACLLKWLSSI